MVEYNDINRPTQLSWAEETIGDNLYLVYLYFASLT